MFLRKIGLLVFSTMIVFAFLALALPGSADENAAGVRGKTVKGEHHQKKPHVKKARTEAQKAGKVGVTDGTHHPEAVRGTQWVTYDDGSREAWAGASVPDVAAAGNKFTSPWGSFYVDMISAYVKWVNPVGITFSMWTATTHTGAALKGNHNVAPFSPSTISGSGWVLVDGSITATGFIGNAASAFSNTAWLGVYVRTGTDIGIDTNGGGSHGFHVTQYQGAGYHEQSWNAMIEARFNGSNVPVEMMSLSVQ